MVYYERKQDRLLLSAPSPVDSNETVTQHLIQENIGDVIKYLPQNVLGDGYELEFVRFISYDGIEYTYNDKTVRIYYIPSGGGLPVKPNNCRHEHRMQINEYDCYIQVIDK